MRSSIILVLSLALAGALVRQGDLSPIARTPEEVGESVIVQGRDVAELENAVRGVGGEITHRLPIIDAVGARLTVGQRERLAAIDGVDRLLTDRALRVANATWTVRDDFGSPSFTNDDGSRSWEAGWVENDPKSGGSGPGAGVVQVTAGELRLDAWHVSGEVSAAREVDLSGAVGSATLSFDYRTSSKVDAPDAIAVEASADGGATFTLLETLTGISGAASGSRSHDLGSLLSEDTVIRFRIAAGYSSKSEYFYSTLR